MSQRTMQRRLKGEGLTFRDVLDSARRQLVGQYAEDRSITRTEMAYLLGYSEPRSLTRAMARWKARADIREILLSGPTLDVPLDR